MKIENFTVAPTENAKVGRSSIAEYFYEHIQSLKTADNNNYNDIISESETLYNEIFSDISHCKQNLSQQVNLTKEKKNIKDEFGDLINAFEASLIIKFKKNSLQRKEVFPNGTGAYKKATIDEIRGMMELIESHAVKYDIILNTNFADGFKNIRIKYFKIFDKQKATQTQVKSIIPNYKTKKKLIDKQILKNIATILLQNLDEPTALCIYFNNSLITPRHKTKTDKNNKPYTLAIAPNTHIAANISFSVKDTLLISNTGTVSVFYYSATTANAAIPASIVEILPDEEVEITATSLGAPNNKFLIFTTKDMSVAGEVEIILV